ncbi:hypothetical protein TNCV_4860111 [Trichonephila clavipes]|nr:hypothetical protein TNCV_4860111 [Trichonephila clavipes]
MRVITGCCCCRVFPEEKEYKLPEPETQVGLIHDRWRHHLSPPPQFRHGTEGGGKYSPTPCTRWFCCDRAQGFRTHGFNEHILRVYSEDIWLYRTSSPGLLVRCSNHGPITECTRGKR